MSRISILYFLIGILFLGIVNAQIPKNISYQGVLTFQNGTALSNDNYELIFKLYDSENATNPVWTESRLVLISDGVFNVVLGEVIPLTMDFDIQYWLGITVGVGGTELSPRTKLTPSVYSLMAKTVEDGAITQDKLAPGLSLPPGGIAGGDLVGDYPSPRVTALNGVPIANMLPDSGATQILKFFGDSLYYMNDNSHDHAGQAFSNTSNTDAGLDINNNSASGYAFTADKTGNAGVAAYARNNGTTGSGAAGYSNGWYGVYGYTGVSSHNYGFYSPDNLYSRNLNKSGASMQVVRNGGSISLEEGDVVTFSGVTFNDDHVIAEVSSMNVSSEAAIAGVVFSRYSFDEIKGLGPEGMVSGNIEITPAGDVAPGEYMLLVVQGPALVKTDASEKSINPGELLSAENGIAKSISAAKNSENTGKIVGKALESNSGSKEEIYVFVTTN